MKKRSSRCNSEAFKEQQMDSDDISLLQRPLRTAHTGFEEARRAYEDGTNEVRQLLSLECSLIYECKVCRNMFRSLANFISHKRVFCCVSARTAQQNGYTDQNSTMIIQTGNGPSPQDIEHMLRSRSTGCSPVPREVRPIRGSIRDLSGVIERLRREKAPSSMQNTPTVLKLESVPTSSQAVYQTIKIDQDDSMRTELNEVHHMLNPANTVVGPDGKAMTKIKFERRGGSDSGETAEQSISDDTEANIFCETCNLTFQTHKTLHLHIQKNHSSSTFVFQCPACSETFLQAAAVIRHLSKEHKKPRPRIRMMRSTILKRRIKQGDIQPKGPSRELKRLQMSDDVVGYPSEPVDANGEQRKIMSLCYYCEKSFERRAALSTHLLNCRAKQEALAKPAPGAKKLKTNESVSNASSFDGADAEDPPAGDVDLSSLGRTIKQEPDADSTALNEMFADLAEKNESFVTGLHTVSLDKLQLRHETDSASVASSSTNNSEESLAQESNPDESKTKVKKKRSVPIEKQLRCRCKLCNKEFNALGNLRRHISMFHYRKSRFGCNVCNYRAFRRYDIVNHLGFVHKIEGDRDQLTEQYVSTQACEYSREDVDADIILVDEVEEARQSQPIKELEIKPPIKTYEKRMKRAKTTEPVAEANVILPSTAIKKEPDLEVAEPVTSKKHRKSRIQLSPESGEQNTEKRPTRKRVKAVNKDFVYDMVRSKQEGSATYTAPAPLAIESMRAKLRRHVGNDENKPKQWEAYITEAKKPLVQGITRRIMLELVSQGRAVSATLPELPSERPQIRPRLISHTRSESQQQQHVVEPESFIEKIAKRTAAAGKDTAVISNLWNKVNTAMAQQQGLSLPKKEESEESPLEMTPPNSKLSALVSPPSPPRKSQETVDSVETPTQPTPTSMPRPPPFQSSAGMECLSSNGSQASKFPALPKPPSVLQAAANGTIQLTLDSLLRAALQN
ncbi:zinc finger protein 800 isoform X1 [Drosophila guanche]|uniref:Blast:Zinc finger protein 800 n=1 Tax=Drosophila guanche TaxID=7266 RepID=A0A3B0JKJ2_DROGU|nr:zinc finger protein 800 isoform X1 [Drosophila guanche]SPP82844.1 blast:Zinc finger protein 800 [Drosophila guanche]